MGEFQGFNEFRRNIDEIDNDFVKRIKENRNKDVVFYSSLRSMEIYFILKLIDKIEIVDIENIMGDTDSINVKITIKNADYYSVSLLCYLGLRGLSTLPKVNGLNVKTIYWGIIRLNRMAYYDIEYFSHYSEKKLQTLKSFYDLVNGDSEKMLDILSVLCPKNVILDQGSFVYVDNDFNHITHRVGIYTPEYKDLLKSWGNEYNKLKQQMYSTGLSTTRWKNEYTLFLLVKTAFNDAIYQYRNSNILGRQSLDIYIPSKQLGIEYQGKQHYEAVDYFGGEKHLVEQKKSDETKKRKCLENGITLYEWNYEDIISIDTVNKVFFKLGYSERCNVEKIKDFISEKSDSDIIKKTLRKMLK